MKTATKYRKASIIKNTRLYLRCVYAMCHTGCSCRGYYVDPVADAIAVSALREKVKHFVSLSRNHQNLDQGLHFLN